MRHLALLAGDVEAWGKSDPSVRAILWYGSMARGDASAHSDLDVAVVHAPDVRSGAVVDSVAAWFGGRVRYHTQLAGRPEATLWVDDSLVKIDLHMAVGVAGLAWLADSPDIAPPRLVAALDKDGVCGNLVERAAARVPRELSALVDQEIEKFVVGFEACSAAHRRSDGYQYYFHYNLALHRLARLVELSRGQAVYLFLPKLLLSRRMSLPEQVRWRELHGTLYLPEANAAKRRLADAFIGTVEELASRCRVARSVPELRAFLDDIIARDLFFNVRDFADAYGGAVRPGLLFRASSLARWKDEPALRSWLSDRAVRLVIDFRHPAEMSDPKDQYPQDLLRDIRYVSLPLSGAPREDATPLPEQAGHSYVRLLRAQLANVVAALRLIAEEREGATVVHCHVGKDRTGWFCAILALLLGMPEEQVAHDYMLSGQGVAEEAIRHFVAAVREAGGAAALLQKAAYADEDYRRLAMRLLTERVAP